VELFEGTNKKVIVNVTPSDGYNVFDWKSDNEEVATVADDGIYQSLISYHHIISRFT